MANVLDMFFRPSKIRSGNDISLDGNMLQLLVAIDGRKTVRQLAAEAEMGASDFKTSFKKLLKHKLIEPAGKRLSPVDEAFFTRVSGMLVELAGPLGQLLVDEAIRILGLTPSSLDQSDLPKFIEVVCDHLPGEKQRTEFRHRMKDAIKKL